MDCFYYIRRIGFLCVLVICGLKAFAQNVVFSANASASKMGDKDQLQVDYTIQDLSNMRTFIQPNFKDFDVVQGSPFRQQSTNISVVGNKMVQSQSVTYSYLLRPKKTGTLTIPPAGVKDADGKTYQSNGLSVEVVNGSMTRQRQARDPFADAFDDPFAAMMRQRRQAMQQRSAPQPEPQATSTQDIGKDLFIKVTVDKTRAHVGEQITASYKLYARIPMNVGISKLPSLNGFWTQDFEKPNGAIPPTEEVVDGKRYQVFLLKKSALFPQQEGTLYLDPAEAEGTARIIQKVRQRNPFADMMDDPFFQQFGSLMMSDPAFSDDMFSTMAYKDVPVKLKSQPVKISVLPLPADKKPAGFGNAVGQFNITGRVDKTDLTTDDALTYTLTISGSGNLKLIEAPALKLPNGLNTYDPQVIDTITGRSTTITGSKIITYAISPNTPGDYEIPAVPFSYYNPQTGQYVTLHTQPVKLSVAKGKNYNPAIAKREAMTDIHPIASKPLDGLEPQSKPLVFTVTYWSMYALPLMAFIGLTFYRRREEELSKDVVKLRNKRANKVALKRLSGAQKLLAQNAKQPFYEEVSKALWLYMSDKLNIPLSSLSRERAFDALQAKQVPYPLQQRLGETVTACETALYAPSSGTQQMQHTYAEAIDIISKLEEHI